MKISVHGIIDKEFLVVGSPFGQMVRRLDSTEQMWSTKFTIISLLCVVCFIFRNEFCFKTVLVSRDAFA